MGADILYQVLTFIFAYLRSVSVSGKYTLSATNLPLTKRGDVGACKTSLTGAYGVDKSVA